MNGTELLKYAEEARKQSYCPYSGFAVGAALMCTSGKIYLGCNIENSAYSTTICAERVAFCKAISEGERKFESIAIVGGRDGVKETCYPCGVCRQFMSEFCSSDFKLYFYNGEKVVEYLYDEILPHRFTL